MQKLILLYVCCAKHDGDRVRERKGAFYAVLYVAINQFHFLLGRRGVNKCFLWLIKKMFYTLPSRCTASCAEVRSRRPA
jgi:hypothetical protein